VQLREVELAAWRAALRRDAGLREQPARRRAHGIVHTPPELARGVVNVLDELLRERFALARGVTDRRVHVVDPACGPGAFLAAVLARHETAVLCSNGAVAVAGHAHAHVHAHDNAHAHDDAQRISGFDLDSDALELSRELLSHPAAARLELVQADMINGKGEPLFELAASSERVLVLLGNPPWASARGQPSPTAQLLLEDFRRDAHGVRLNERKLGVLSDAYVRFFRVCAEAARLARAGAIIGLVSNASFLDGPVHRGMRAALLRWFDELFVLDLGGSALLARTAGTRDDNVFGVRPSVAVTWLCRYPSATPRTLGRLQYARWSGDKRDKLARLTRDVRADFGWQTLTPAPPLLRFVPTRKPRPEYAAYLSLAQSLPFHREGVQSNRDGVAIDDDPARLLARLHAFANGHGSGLPELVPALRALPHYDPVIARARVAAVLERDPDGRLGLSVQPIAYRPFDERFFCAVAPLCHRPRPELLGAFAHSPLALVSVRKDRGSAIWTHVAASASIIDNCFLSARSSCRARAFPTLTPDGEDNLAEHARERIVERTGTAVSALSFQHYALGCLSAPSYRARWDEELRQDYARVPLPPSAAIWSELSGLGQRLARLFVEPFGPCTPAAEAFAGAGARFRDLVIDAARGCVLLHGQPALRASSHALALRVGHHRPLAAYIAARSARLLDMPALAALHARSERLTQLAALLVELDGAFQRGFGELAAPLG
jgi:hypothetical protein